MTLEGKSIGVALTGSFCMYTKVFTQLENLVNENAEVTTIFSNAAQTIDSRFGNASDFLDRARTITKHEPICTIATAEPIGPKALFDALLIAPCTGNTIAKLSNAITDTPVLMAAKAHLRNERPLIIALSSNDALGFNMKNVGLLLNSKHIYFVPFGQDSCVKKPNSLISHMDLIIPTIELALEGKQLQPVIQSY